MYKLLSVNGLSLPKPEGELVISTENKYNEYEGEDGYSTVEVIRRDIRSLSVSYKNLTEQTLQEIVGVLKFVSTVVIYNPMTGVEERFTAKITEIKTAKVWYQNGKSIWSLSFSLEEL